MNAEEDVKDESIWETGEIFKNEEVLNEHYTPDEIPEREGESAELVRGLRRVFRGGEPKNMFLQGKTGQGKTASARYVLDEFEKRASQHDIDVETIFQSCSNHSSSYHLACNLVERFTGTDPNGHPQQKVFDKMYAVLEERAENIVIVFDEIDSIGEKHDILYDIPRARDNNDIEDTKIGIIGITNDSTFLQSMDPRTKSSLYDGTIQFDAYEADDLQNILQRRVEKAFLDGVVENSAIQLCAAYAAQDKGSARQAIDYLYEAGDVAIDHNSSTVTDEHVREAEERVNKRNVTQSISGLTVQDHLTLCAVVSLALDGNEPARTRQVYSEYSNLTRSIDVNSLAMDRVRDHLQDLDMIGVIDGELRSGGSEGGKKYYWQLNTDIGATIEVLQEIDRLSDLMELIASGSNEQLSRYS